MQIAIGGGGPVGIFTAMSLARRGHHVTLVDRDPGPDPDGTWERAGVMQFMHPHGFRAQVRHALRAELPDVHDALLAAGAEVRLAAGMPEHAAGFCCRRSVVERTLRTEAQTEPNLRWITGHVDRLLVEHDRAEGLVVDGAHLAADAVIVATGRSSRLGDELRGPIEGGSCGFSYISRMYRARPGLPGCDLPLPVYSMGPGYYSVVLPQDDATHSLLLCYPTRGSEFAALRTNDGYQRAVSAIPNAAMWSDPSRFEPITDAMVGGNLTNTYRLQGPSLGMPPARGLFFLGDAVATLNPIAGRYLGLALPHAQQLVAALDRPDTDLADASLVLDTWAEQHIRPWFLDHVHWDETLLRRFAGEDIAVDARIPSDVVCAAAAVEPSVVPAVLAYSAMAAGPDVLDPVRPTVRRLLEDGWRPALTGPTAAELTDLLAA
jgi:2-polyprenyl-6-methoxyphenol hydroxylase-like FAD-dependent oxidoreductase